MPYSEESVWERLPFGALVVSQDPAYTILYSNPVFSTIVACPTKYLTGASFSSLFITREESNKFQSCVEKFQEERNPLECVLKADSVPKECMVSVRNLDWSYGPEREQNHRGPPVLVEVNMWKSIRRTAAVMRGNSVALEQSSGHAVISCNLSGSIVWVNSGAERLVGALSTELMNKNINVIMPKSIAAIHKGFMARYEKHRNKRPPKFVNTEKTISSTMLHASSGKEVKVSIRLQESLGTDGTPLLYALLTPEEIENDDDSPTQTLVDNMVQDKESSDEFLFLRAMITSLHLGMIVVDPAGEILHISSYGANILGYSRDELEGELLDVLIADPEERENHMDYICDYFSQRTRRIVGGVARKVQMLTKDNDMFPAMLHIQETEMDGSVVLVGLYKDATDAHNVEKASGNTLVNVQAVADVCETLGTHTYFHVDECGAIQDCNGSFKTLMTKLGTKRSHFDSERLDNMVELDPVLVEEYLKHVGTVLAPRPLILENCMLYVDGIDKGGSEGVAVSLTLSRNSSIECKCQSKWFACISVIDMKANLLRGKLLDSTAWFDGTFTIAADGILLTSDDTIVSLNDEAARILGLPLDSARGESLESYFPRIIRSKAKTVVHQLEDKAQNRIISEFEADFVPEGWFETVVNQKNGPYVPCVVSVKRIEVQRRHQVILFIRDITEAKNKVRMMQTELLKQGEVLRCAGDAVIVTDDEGIVETFNDSAESMFGVSAKEILGKNVKMIMLNEIAEQHDGFVERYRQRGTRHILGTKTVQKAMNPHKGILDIELRVNEAVCGSRRKFVGVLRDITAEVKADYEISMREEQLQGAVNSASACIVVIDNHGSIQVVNDACRSVFGYSKDQLIGKNVSMLIPPPYDEEHQEHIDAFFDRGCTSDLVLGKTRQLSALKSDGSVFWADISVTLSSIGSQHQLTAVIEDVSVRRAEADHLKRNVQLSKMLIENSVDAIVVADEKGTVETFNASACAIFDCKSSDVIGKNVSVLMPPEVGKVHNDYVARYMKTRIKQVVDAVTTHEARTLSGNTVIVSLSLTEAIVNERRVFTAMMNDITKEVHENEETSVRVQRLTSVLNGSNTSIIVSNYLGKILEVNRSLEKLFGYSSRELMGQNIKVLMTRTDRNHHDEHMDRYMRTGVKRILDQRRLVQGRSADGEVMPLFLRVVALKVGRSHCFAGLFENGAMARLSEEKKSVNSLAATILPRDPMKMAIAAAGPGRVVLPDEHIISPNSSNDSDSQSDEDFMRSPSWESPPVSVSSPVRQIREMRKQSRGGSESPNRRHLPSLILEGPAKGRARGMVQADNKKAHSRKTSLPAQDKFGKLMKMSFGRSVEEIQEGETLFEYSAEDASLEPPRIEPGWVHEDLVRSVHDEVANAMETYEKFIFREGAVAALKKAQSIQFSLCNIYQFDAVGGNLKLNISFIPEAHSTSRGIEAFVKLCEEVCFETSECIIGEAYANQRCCVFQKLLKTKHFGRVEQAFDAEFVAALTIPLHYSMETEKSSQIPNHRQTEKRIFGAMEIYYPSPAAQNDVADEDAIVISQDDRSFWMHLAKIFGTHYHNVQQLSQKGSNK